MGAHALSPRRSKTTEAALQLHREPARSTVSPGPRAPARNKIPARLWNPRPRSRSPQRRSSTPPLLAPPEPTRVVVDIAGGGGAPAEEEASSAGAPRGTRLRLAPPGPSGVDEPAGGAGTPAQEHETLYLPVLRELLGQGVRDLVREELEKVLARHGAAARASARTDAGADAFRGRAARTRAAKGSKDSAGSAEENLRAAMRRTVHGRDESQHMVDSVIAGAFADRHNSQGEAAPPVRRSASSIALGAVGQLYWAWQQLGHVEAPYKEAMKNLEPDAIQKAHNLAVENRLLEAKLRELCSVVDVDSSGKISQGEWRSAMEDGRLSELLGLLGFSSREFHEFFSMLSGCQPGAAECGEEDADEYLVDADCFVNGCLALRGTASNFDMNVARFELTSIKQLLRAEARLLQRAARGN